MRRHDRFIRTELSTVVTEAVNASRCIPVSIAASPVCDYIFQSLFLRMTGFQEQKMKCLCWEMATDNYEFRRDYLRQNQEYGEMSTLDSKKKVYQKLLNLIKQLHPAFELSTGINRDDIITDTKQFLLTSFKTSPLSQWNLREANDFSSIYDKDVKSEYIAHDDNTLLSGNLENIYSKMYDHRNRCAHNVLSYQQNLPSLSLLSDKSHRFDNYYLRFAVLLLIDKVFISMFETYEDLLVR